jgi:hypothetical protein
MSGFLMSDEPSIDSTTVERTTVDRAVIEEHLRQAEHHVADGERHIAEQHELIGALERDGHDTATARELLATLQQTQSLHIFDRDRLLEELSAESS